jgi:hypothetical protein
MPDDAFPFGVPSVGAHLIKVAARITAATTWVRLIIADTCPKADLFSGVVRSILPSGDNLRCCSRPAPSRPKRNRANTLNTLAIDTGPKDFQPLRSKAPTGSSEPKDCRELIAARRVCLLLAP